MASDATTFFLGFASIFGVLGWYLWHLERKVDDMRHRLEAVHRLPSHGPAGGVGHSRDVRTRHAPSRTPVLPGAAGSQRQDAHVDGPAAGAHVPAAPQGGGDGSQGGGDDAQGGGDGIEGGGEGTQGSGDDVLSRVEGATQEGDDATQKRDDAEDRS